MKIAFLVTRLEKPSARYRVLQYLPYLETRGWKPEVFVLPKNLSGFRDLSSHMNSFDVVFLQKKPLSWWSFSLLRKNAGRLVYDFDDAVMFRDSWKGRPHSLKRRRAFGRTVKGADWVVAGNEYLKETAQQYTRRVSIINTPVPVDRYPMKNTGDRTGGVTLGWIGSRATVNYLELLRDVFTALTRQFPFLKIKVISDDFPKLEGMNIQKKPWKSEEELSDLHSFDIGLMPLTDDLWSRGKCGFKLLQYMAAGLPVVCSPIGMNREIVEDGVQGYWASSGEEWVEKLSRLIQDPELRDRMGREGRKRVKEKYSLTVLAPELEKVLNAL